MKKYFVSIAVILVLTLTVCIYGQTNNLFVNSSGNVGIGTANPDPNKLEVVDGPIKATGGLIIETRTSDPTSPVTGQIWLRTDI